MPASAAAPLPLVVRSNCRREMARTEVSKKKRGGEMDETGLRERQEWVGIERKKIRKRLQGDCTALIK
jgi:hypothetical protein